MLYLLKILKKIISFLFSKRLLSILFHLIIRYLKNKIKKIFFINKYLLKQKKIKILFMNILKIIGYLYKYREKINKKNMLNLNTLIIKYLEKSNYQIYLFINFLKKLNTIYNKNNILIYYFCKKQIELLDKYIHDKKKKIIHIIAKVLKININKFDNYIEKKQSKKNKKK